MTWSKEKSWGNGQKPSFSIDPHMNELGRTDASYQPSLPAETIAESVVQVPMVLIDGTYVEVPLEGDPREVFGVEVAFDENGFHVKKTLEDDMRDRERHQTFLRQQALKDLHIHPPVDWGPNQGKISKEDNSVMPDNLTYSA